MAAAVTDAATQCTNQDLGWLIWRMQGQMEERFSKIDAAVEQILQHVKLPVKRTSRGRLSVSTVDETPRVSAVMTARERRYSRQLPDHSEIRTWKSSDKPELVSSPSHASLTTEQLQKISAESANAMQIATEARFGATTFASMRPPFMACASVANFQRENTEDGEQSVMDSGIFEPAEQDPKKVPFALDSWLLNCMRMVFSIMNVVQFTWVGIHIAQNNWDEPTPSELSVMSAFSAITMLMVAANFLQARRVGWKVLQHPVEVAHVYAKSWLAFDLVFMLPWDIISFLVGAANPAYRIFQTLRCVQLMRLPSIFQRKHPLRKPHIRFRLFLGVLWSSVALVLFALVWMGIAEPHVTGARALDLVDALYWAITTLSTVGYGDIVPDNLQQKLYASVMMMVGTTVLSFLIGHLSLILQRSDRQHELEDEKTQRLLELMEFYKVPWSVQKDVMDIFPHLLRSSRTSQLQLDILTLFPTSVQQTLNKYVKLNLLSAVPFFSGAEMDVFDEIAEALEEEVHAPGDEVVSAGDSGDSMYFISHGVLEVLIENAVTGDVTQVADLRPGQFFGEITLLLKVPRTATVRCITACTLFSLSCNSFEQIVMKHPKLMAAVRKEVDERIRSLKEHTGLAEARQSWCAQDSDVAESTEADCVARSPAVATPHYGEASGGYASVSAAIEKWETRGLSASLLGSRSHSHSGTRWSRTTSDCDSPKMEGKQPVIDSESKLLLEAPPATVADEFLYIQEAPSDAHQPDATSHSVLKLHVPVQAS
eukprot:TRINITY_DN5780_c0_g1_i1.p1 TRINITY_DN5780_c0_g1~~TRINITY_DN5780_c0_g1_i1.p1  ORF type:complete len:767 (+),score=109.83 TRINITY_DN5780_c0_g1_i1:45-2345(+)